MRTVISSIARQEVNPELIRVLLIDNASNPELERDLLAPIADRGIGCRIVQEPKLGLHRARIRAIQETTGEWILFVDDDNELSPDFIKHGLVFLQDHPDVGCFGGRLLLPNEIQPANWVKPFLPWLGIKDEGAAVIFGTGEQWGPWEPPGAGAWVHRKVLDEYLCRSQKDERLCTLGRTGKGNLASCDDSMMMRGSSNLGLKSAYVPDLALRHHLDQSRFRFRYLIRLMWAYGESHVVLESVLRGPHHILRNYKKYRKPRMTLLISILSVLWVESRKSVPYAIGMIAYHLGARQEYLAQQSRSDHEHFDASV